MNGALAFTAAALVALIWLAIAYVLLAARRTPKARLQRRMEQMITEAEGERAETAKKRQLSASQAGIVITGHRTKAETPFKERVISPLWQSIETHLSHLAPGELRGMAEQMLSRTGRQEAWSVNRLMASWVMSVATCTMFAIAIIRIHGGLQLTQEVAVLALGVAIGAALPFFSLQSAIRRRKQALRKQLPDFLDLLCVSVQAGLSFDGAVTKIVKRMKGELPEEFSRMLRDTSLGMPKQMALTQVAKRCDLEEMYLFATSVIQAERLGTSMSQTLKIQADNMRDRRRQTNRAAALKAPVKIIFPMILFIFPSIFVMTLFPAVLTLMKSLNK
ncbi:MAG: type II secretion system F family protein [Selenomonadaceae bacterium]|nr:type II secretion system F family protein [Selenomonadaceae bacterium]